MALIFQTLTKHGKLQFIPGVPLAFEDADAEPFFLAAFGAAATDQAPVYTYPQGEVEIDPMTRDNDKGVLVSDLIQEAALNG